MENLTAPELSIDKDGLWYADGVNMFRKEIIQLFASNLEKDADNNYFINWQGQVYPVQVTDVPFLATNIIERDEKLFTKLYDNREVEIPPGEIIIENEIPYLSLFGSKDTKLIQQAYWQLNKYLIERENNYFIKFQNTEWPVLIQS